MESADERAAHNALRALIQVWTEMRPSDALRSMSECLFAIHPLRTAGAIQLAAAILWRQELPTEQRFVSLDHRLCDVGYREGFTVLPKAFWGYAIQLRLCCRSLLTEARCPSTATRHPCSGAHSTGSSISRSFPRRVLGRAAFVDVLNT